jgi:hypothetical protein
MQAIFGESERNVHDNITEQAHTNGSVMSDATKARVARLFSEPGASSIITENSAGATLSNPRGAHARVVAQTMHFANEWRFGLQRSRLNSLTLD